MKALFVLAAACLSLASAAQAADLPNLADRHVAKLGGCQGCHGEGMPKNGAAVTKGQCLACHGGSYEKLAEKTDNLEINPHDSHLGTIECTKCHRGHQKPVLECARCHDFSKELHIR